VSAAVVLRPEPVPTSQATLRQLALADASRYARHPLFVVSAVLAFVLTGLLAVISREPDPVALTILPALFLGVFGFVVAQRLTTSLHRTGELVDALPSSRRLRTGALCLACLVPFATMVLCTVMIIVLTNLYPPVPVPPGAPLVWFGHESWSSVLAILLATGPVAGLGGPLLGVVVGTWAPFRGSAAVGVVLLLVACSAPASAGEGPPLWRALPPWAALSDEHAVHGKVVSSTLIAHLSPVWDLAYVLLLCALAVVAALLHEREGRRPLLWAGGGLVLAAGGALAMTVR
jgi:hypothetical protein